MCNLIVVVIIIIIIIITASAIAVLLTTIVAIIIVINNNDDVSLMTITICTAISIASILLIIIGTSITKQWYISVMQSTS